MAVYTITKAEDGLILRSFLKEKIKLSGRTLAALKAHPRGILIDGAHVTVRAILKEGMVLTLALEDGELPARASSILPVPLSLSVLYEDEHITLCDKAAGMPTHPSHGHYDDTLANGLSYRYRHLPYVFRAINRLDRETSGVLLTARHNHSAARLSLAMKGGEIQKEYLALVHGVTAETGEIVRPIRRVKDSVMLRETAEDGAYAHTCFSRLFTDGSISLVRVRPLTGRTHQIRVHFASLGHPLCGDGLYGREKDGFSRTMLHALSLAFPHPMTGERMRVTAPIPEDFLVFLRAADESFLCRLTADLTRERNEE